MITRSHFPLYVLGLLFVAGAGYAVGRFTTEPVIEATTIPTSSTQLQTTASANPDLALARSEIEALRAENKQLRTQLTAAETEAEPSDSDEQPEAPVMEEPRRSRRDRMAELKETDPERYKEEMERREQFKAMAKQMQADRENFLASIDTSLLSPEAQNNHVRFATAIKKQAQLQEQMMAYRESGEPIPEELQYEMRDTFLELQETRDVERSALLDAIAISMGLAEEEVNDFTHLVNEVINATGGQMMPRMGRGMMPGGDRPPMPR